MRRRRMTAQKIGEAIFGCLFIALTIATVAVVVIYDL
jgi:hypothetical protein